jgi:hypothetical protein
MLSLNLKTHFKAEATNGDKALDAALSVNYSTADLSRFSLPERSMAKRFIEAAKLLDRRDEYADAVRHAFGQFAA